MTRLFVHCDLSVPYAAQIAAAIAGRECYAERSLLLAERGDVVCLSAAVDADHLGFLGSLDVGPEPDDILVLPAGRGNAAEGAPPLPLHRRILEAPDAFDRLVRRVRASRGIAVHPFIVTPGHFELAAALGAAAGAPVRVVGGEPRLVALADRKDHMRAKARELGVPVAEGEAVRLPYPGGRRRGDVAHLAAAITRYLDRTGRVIVRGASGASGSSAFIVGRGGGDVATVTEAIARRGDNDVYLVEVMVDATASPNVQMYVAPDDGAITCLGVTEQRWSRPLVHAGNIFPCRADTVSDMVRQAYALAGWLRGEGYVGLAGFDFVEYRDPVTAEPRALFAEVNPRINGATFPLALLERLNEGQRRRDRPESGAFLSGSVATGARSFAELEERAGHLFYRLDTGSGVVPYLSGLLPHGKCVAAVFGRSTAEAEELFAELRRAADTPAIAGAAAS